MYLKKAICGLMSVGVMAGCMCVPTSAESMEKILNNPDFTEVHRIHTLISTSRFTEFVGTEKSKLIAERHCIEDIQRLDSVLFWCFCVLCIKNGFHKCADSILRFRNYVELKNDDKVIRNDRETIIEKMRDNFGIIVTHEELSAIYSSIMNKRAFTQEYFTCGAGTTKVRVRRSDVTWRQFIVGGKDRKRKLEHCEKLTDTSLF